MTLAEWMAANGLSDGALAEKLKKTRVTVGRYRRGIEIPGGETIKQIVALTAGAVTANELLGIRVAGNRRRGNGERRAVRA